MLFMGVAYTMSQIKVEPIGRFGLFTKGNNISIPMPDGTVFEQTHGYNFEYNAMLGIRAKWKVFTIEGASKTHVLSNGLLNENNPHTQEWTFLAKADIKKVSIGLNYLRYERLTSRYQTNIHNFVPFGEFTELFIGFNL